MSCISLIIELTFTVWLDTVPGSIQLTSSGCLLHQPIALVAFKGHTHTIPESALNVAWKRVAVIYFLQRL